MRQNEIMGGWGWGLGGVYVKGTWPASQSIGDTKESGFSGSPGRTESRQINYRTLPKECRS
jgi:hypothetical protein